MSRKTWLVLMAAPFLLVLAFGEVDHLFRLDPARHPPSTFVRSFDPCGIVEPFSADRHIWSTATGASAAGQIAAATNERVVQPMFYVEPQYRLAILQTLHARALECLRAMHAQVQSDGVNGASEFSIRYRLGPAAGEVWAGNFREITNGRLSAHRPPSPAVAAKIEVRMRETVREPLSLAIWENR